MSNENMISEKTFETLMKLVEEYDRMKNCTNCDHKEVCYIVKVRKNVHANDYTPCENWKIGGVN